MEGGYYSTRSMLDASQKWKWVVRGRGTRPGVQSISVSSHVWETILVVLAESYVKISGSCLREVQIHFLCNYVL